MTPWDDLASRINAPDGTNVYPAMANVIEAPAIVIVPDDPWITDAAYQYDTEGYLAICLVTASTPSDGLDILHQLVHAVREAGGDGWEIGDASAVRDARIPDDNTHYLGSWVKVTFRDCTHGIEEGS